jgi:hypothetical protein
MIKIKTGKNELDPSESQQFHHATHAYVHAHELIPFNIFLIVDGSNSDPGEIL